MQTLRNSRIAHLFTFGTLALAFFAAAPSRADPSLEDLLESEVDADVTPQQDEQEVEAIAEPAADPQTQEEIEKEILSADADLLEEAPNSDAEKTTPAHVPIEINERVRKWIRYFTGVDHARFERFLRRGSAYKRLVQDILKANGVPRELYYLGMIESGYVTHARSRARAAGPWQFMPGTGRLYGLKLGAQIDERQDIIRSTEAAARYLRGLHTAFQSWYLAMASYNAGEGRILGAVVRGNSRNFWELAARKSLPAETRNYVPKMLAALIIGRAPEKYGFRDVEAPEFPAHERAEVPGGVKLSVVAARTGIPLSTLKLMNPHLLRGMTPTSAKTYELWVPAGKSDAVETVRAVLARTRVHSRTGDRRIARSGYHTVRRGQSLSTIAHRYGISVARLKRMNGLKSSRIQAGRRLRVAGM